MPPYIFLADWIHTLLSVEAAVIVVSERAMALRLLLDLINDQRMQSALSDLVILSQEQYARYLRTGWPLPVLQYAVEPLSLPGCEPVLLPSDDACALCAECLLGD